MKTIVSFLFGLLVASVAFSPAFAAPDAQNIKKEEVQASAYNPETLPMLGVAKEKQLGFQEPATPVMEKLDSLHDMLTIIAVVVTVFVLLLMLYVCFRFREKANPVPSKTTHNTLIEIVWTTAPILILVVIAVLSLPLHYEMDRTEKADMTLKIVGYQWYWGYEYPDHGGIAFDSKIIRDDDPVKEKELLAGEPRLLAVDNQVVVPVDTTIRVQVTAADVIHSWAMPAFGVKTDAVPGRLNETWFRATKKGIFYGQCSELCGVSHGFMPIAVRVVSKEEFAAWVEHAKKKFAANGGVQHIAGLR